MEVEFAGSVRLKGLFLYTPDSGHQRIAMVGDRIGAETVADISIAGLLGSGVGSGTNFRSEESDCISDAGEVVFRIETESGESAIVGWNLRRACPADISTENTNPGEPGYGEPNGVVNGADLSYFVENWLGANAAVADLTTSTVNPGEPGYGEPDGEVNGADLSYYVEAWLAGCP